jgi:hypothetical protein
MLQIINKYNTYLIQEESEKYITVVLKRKYYVGFEVLTAVGTKMAVF